MKSINFEVSDLSIDDGVIKISERLKDRIIYGMIDTNESHIREALIRLGWTPPPSVDDKEQK